MAKIKHTKNELKKQKDELKRFTRYLPTLVLKKQQLQTEIVKTTHAIAAVEERINKLNDTMSSWVGVFAEDVGIFNLVRLDRIETTSGNIAGIDIPNFKEAVFSLGEYDMPRTPIWVDFGIAAAKDMISLKAEIIILREQMRLIHEELRITTQRVNLFEKIKIPEAKEHIRRIRIFLGDVQTAGVVTGKIAKGKIEKKSEMAAVA